MKLKKGDVPVYAKLEQRKKEEDMMLKLLI